MEEYFDHFLSTSSWLDVDVKERSSWGFGELGQPNGLLPNSIGIYEDDHENSPANMINSNQTVDSLVVQDTSSIFLGQESNYGFDKVLLSGEAQRQNDDQSCNGNAPPNGMVNGTLKVENTGMQYNIAIPTLGSLNFGSSKQLPVVGGLTRSSLNFTDSRHVGCNGSEMSELQRSLKDLQTLSPIPQLWPSSSYEGVSSLSAVMGQDRMQGFGLRGEYVGNDVDVMGNRYVEVDKILSLDNLSASVTAKGKQEQHNHPLSSSPAGTQITMTDAGLQSLLQNTSATSSSGCNGTGKPRVRARRGQATDPHSIAERLRREKIAERMKNLQELVPNSNKTDKASMLDEIIEYVKFLQLQVKVLSMSRLGAAGAVVPLITDGQVEGPNGLLLSPTAAQGADISLSPDHIAFELEVVKLMESNVTMAMQYLQSKGLCLMPIALAAALSSRKASTSPVSERKNFGFTSSLGHNNSSSSSSSLPGIRTHQMFSDGIIMVDKLTREGNAANGCNGACTQEEAKSTSHTAS